MKVTRAYLISLEGIEGSGKSTQCRRLARSLRSRGLDVVVFREPGSSAFGEAIRRILLHGRGELSSISETLLFMAARAELVRQKIQPQLSRSDVIILDRFADATMAYQGYGAGVDRRLIARLNGVVTAGIMPDLTLLFDVAAPVGLGRCSGKDRFERRKIAFHQKVRRGYLSLARREPRRIKIIKVDGAAGEVAARVRKVVDHALCGRGKS